MPTLKQKAVAYDALLAEIQAREPSVDLIMAAPRLPGANSTEARFLWCFDRLIDEHKRNALTSKQPSTSAPGGTWPSWLRSRRA